MNVVVLKKQFQNLANIALYNKDPYFHALYASTLMNVNATNTGETYKIAKEIADNLILR
jgi:hypothetical protein